jgi:hypothetical protein
VVLADGGRAEVTANRKISGEGLAGEAKIWRFWRIWFGDLPRFREIWWFSSISVQ